VLAAQRARRVAIAAKKAAAKATDPTAWCKLVTAKNAPQDQHPRGSGKKCPYNAFCFEHTPRQLPGPPGL
jgi:hypothetical protein